MALDSQSAKISELDSATFDKMLFDVFKKCVNYFNAVCCCEMRVGTIDSLCYFAL